MTDLLAELSTDADAALEYDRLAEERRQRIRSNLPLAHAQGAGFTQLERAIKSLYVAKTISNMVKNPPPAGGARKRKRAGAAPDIP